MNERQQKAHMTAALGYSQLSYCERKKVGCVIVKNNSIISIGYNGTPQGWDNTCEDCNNKTHPHVIHAEANAILKLARYGGDGDGCSIFITHSPCVSCAMLIATIGAKEVYYSELYRDDGGIQLLLQHNIPVYHLPLN